MATEVSTDPRSVAVVYGRDLRARDAIFAYLRRVGLEPREWDQAIDRTETGAPTILQTVRALLNRVQAVVVLFTPDDLAMLHPGLDDHRNQAESRYRGQPRQNVLLEAGMALAMMEHQTIFVQVGEVRSASDLHGISMIRLDESPESVIQLTNRLRRAGCPVADATQPQWSTAYGQAVEAARLRQGEPQRSYRPEITVFEALRDTGLIDIESRTEAGDRILPPGVFYQAAKTEVAITATSAANTFHHHDGLLRELLARGLRLRFMLLDPRSPDLARLSEREGRSLAGDIEGVLDVIRRARFGEVGDLQVRLSPTLAPFTGVMIDGGIGETPGSPFDGRAEIRIQPGARYGTQHNGVILHFANLGKGSPFEFFASDLRHQWTVARVPDLSGKLKWWHWR